MEEPSKRCPACEAEVLSAARICKHCRHRFDGPDAPPEPAPGSLAAPAPRQKRRTGFVLAWVFFTLALVGIAVALQLGAFDSASSVSDPSDRPVITGTRIEAKLRRELRAQSGAALSGVSCPSASLEDGDSINCEVTFRDGRVQGIVVTVSGTSGRPRLDIDLE